MIASGRILVALAVAFLVLLMLVSATLIVGAMALLEDQVIGLRQDVMQLTAKVDELQKELATLRADTLRRQAWEGYSRSGRCAPDIDRLIVEAWEGSSRTVPLAVIRRLVWVESRCLPDAVSPRKAAGLLQVREEAALALGYAPEAMLDPKTGLEAGITYLELMLELSGGDMEAALTRYNWGPTRYQNAITTKQFARTILGGKP